MAKSEDGIDDYVVRVRGLPWSCTEQQLREFFSEEGQKPDKITTVHFTYNREGRPSGEAYLKFSDNDSYEGALLKDKEYLNKRYVEVFPSKQAEMEYVVKHSGKSSSFGGEVNDDAVVRMRGLPYGCTKEEIASFFLGLEISPNGIVMLNDPYTGRATGESFVQFLGKDIAEKALQKHMQKIGHRYIEVFRSSAEEMRRFLRRTGGGEGGRGSGGGGGYQSRGGGDTSGMNMGSGIGSNYADWSPASGPQSLFASGYSSMSNAIEAGYGTGGELMYVGRSMRSTPYDRPSYGGARARPTPLVATMTSMGAYASRGYNNGGRMMAGAGGDSFKGYPEGGYASGIGGGGGGRAGRLGSGHYVHMRGLPYSATDKDVIEFFSPIRIASVEVLYENNGRPSGEANVEFYTHSDAQEAIKRDRAMLGHRYVELFLNSSNSSAAQSLFAGGGYRDFAD